LNLHYQTTKNQLMMLKKNLLLLAFAIIGLTVSAQQPQSKEDLQKQQQQLQKEISELNKTLSDIQKNKKRSLGELTAVKRKIAAREQMVNNISRDMKRLDDNIYLTNLDIYRYTRELDTLKQQYAQSLVFAYKNRSNYDYLNFIFSASNFNDAIKRVQYLKSYRRQRETQVSSILKTQQVLQQKISILNTNKNEKNLALQEQSKTLKELENDRKEKDKVVTSLKSQEKDLAAQIKRKDKERRDLANAISSIIKRELAAIKKKEEDDRKKALANANANKPATTPSTTPKTTPSGAPATSGLTTAEKTGTMEKFDSPSEEQSLVFESNRGRLPWPVDAGYVSIDFGTYELPGTKLKGVSDGIEITLPVGSGVKSIADGEVSSVFDLGGEQAVVVRHGRYFTTYSHLATVNVSKGQKVRSGTVVGKAAADEGGNGMVLFMVSNEKGSPLDPEKWLKRR
jgi:septal ring factor EnvC (AmiA/AmiB activator)